MYTKDTTQQKKIQVVKGTHKPKGFDIVKVRYEGDTYATVIHQERPTKTHVRKIDSKRYEVLSTGEIKEYQPMSQDQKRRIRRQTLNRTFNDLCGLIRYNFVNSGEKGCNAQLFITLTYADNMVDGDKAKKDLNLFITKLNKKYKGIYDLEYIAVIEPQERGAWHFHIMLKATNTDWLWIEYSDLNRLWKHGYTDIQRLRSDDIGRYYVTYFTALMDTGEEDKEDATSEDTYRREKSVKNPSKKVKKGSRLEMYTPNMKFYSKSRGIKKPSYEETPLCSLEEDGYKEDYVRQYDIYKKAEDNSIEILNRVYKATYAKNPKPKNKAKRNNNKAPARSRPMRSPRAGT